MERSKRKVSLITDDGGESVWAISLGNHRYQIDNIPFFAYNISLGDVVKTAPAGRTLQAEQIVQKSGHRTLRVAFAAPLDVDSPQAQTLLSQLVSLGCTYEGFPPLLLAVDVPPLVDINAVISHCDVAGFTWEYGDPQPERPNCAAQT